MLYHAETRGNVFDVIYTEDASNPGNDCYAPHTFKLAYGNGEFVDKNGKQWSDMTLVNLGIAGVHPRRAPDGSRLMNSTFTGTTRWGRRAMLRLNNRPSRTTRDIETDLAAIISLTIKYNTLIDNGAGKNQYRFGALVQEINPNDGELVSLDHYFPDASVLEILKMYFGEPRADFVSENEERASVYFAKFRSTYPPAAHLWGYEDKEGETLNDESSAASNDVDKYRA